MRQTASGGAARTYGRGPARGGLAHEVAPHTGQPRQQVLVLRELDLELALARARPLGEDVEDEAGAVEDLDAQLLREHPQLRGRELVIEYGEVAGGV